MVKKIRKPKEESQEKQVKQAKEEGFVGIGFLGQNPSWQLSIVDQVGPFRWPLWATNSDFWRNIYDRLSAMEKMTWHDIITRTGSHLIPIAELSPLARKRSSELHQLDAIDELFSLRITAKRRIWGVLDHAVLKILWWDPDHQVYPVAKKHT